jgi:serine/threonine protein kinase
LDMVPKEGDRLGRFEIERKIGEGSMGIVYLARDTLLGIPVAIKLLSPAIRLNDDESQDRFKREVLVARQVAHPGVCRLFDIHQEKDNIFLSMEYVAGRTLKSILQERRILPPAEAVEIMLSIAEGVTAAHELDIVHRDLKPGNIIVAEGGRVSILDFGLSKALKMASITRTGVQVGTVNYMSSEVLRGKVASVRSDIYSLGVILYECVCGRLPFEGNNIQQIGRAIETSQVIPPSELNPSVAPVLEQVILKAMSRDPDERYANVKLFISALKGARKNAPPPLPRQADDSGPISEPNRPWDRDIDKSVRMIIGDPDSSSIIKARMRDTTILFSDIMGITTYFDTHGDVAGMRKINKHNELLFPVIERYDGRVIKTIGDAIMACFDSADNGVGAAIGMQRALARHNAEFTSNDDKILVRIGLNSGQSIFQNSDVFGDSVNVAARIGAKAGANQILVSETTQQALNPDLHATRYFSEVKLKGKEEPARLYTVEWAERAEQPTTIISMADLPESVAKSIERENPKSASWNLFANTSRRLKYLIGGGVAVAIVVVTVFALFHGRGEMASDAGSEIGPAAINIVDAGSQLSSPGDAHTRMAADPGPGEDVEVPDEAEKPDAGESVESATSVSPARSFSERRRLHRLTKKIARLAGRKGIIAGDNTRLDEARDRLRGQKQNGQYKSATKTAKRALVILKRIKVDRELVSKKLLRFNGLFDQADAATRGRLDRYSGKIGQAIFEKKFSTANRLLNDAIKLLK